MVTRIRSSHSNGLILEIKPLVWNVTVVITQVPMSTVYSQDAISLIWVAVFLSFSVGLLLLIAAVVSVDIELNTAVILKHFYFQWPITHLISICAHELIHANFSQVILAV